MLSLHDVRLKLFDYFLGTTTFNFRLLLNFRLFCCFYQVASAGALYDFVGADAVISAGPIRCSFGDR
jgi:hypothetical protein